MAKQRGSTYEERDLMQNTVIMNKRYYLLDYAELGGIWGLLGSFLVVLIIFFIDADGLWLLPYFAAGILLFAFWLSVSTVRRLLRFHQLPMCKAAEIVGDTAVIYQYTSERGHFEYARFKLNDVQSCEIGAQSSGRYRGQLICYFVLAINLRPDDAVVLTTIPRGSSIAAWVNNRPLEYEHEGLINYPVYKIKKMLVSASNSDRSSGSVHPISDNP